MNNKIDLTTVALSPRGTRFTRVHPDYNFVKSIIDKKVRQFSFELMANGDVMKLTASGNFLLGLKRGDEFVINATHRDLSQIAKQIVGHKRYVFFAVETEIVGEQLFGKCY